MSGLVKNNIEDLTYEAVDANLVGGNLVIPSTTATVSGRQGIKVATDAALTVLGAVAKDCVTEANRAALETGSGPAPGNFPFVDASVPGATAAVYNRGVYKLQYTAVAVAYGVKLCAAAAGKVRAWVSGTDSPAAIIGWCAEPGGVASGGGTGRVYLNV